MLRSKLFLLPLTLLICLAHSTETRAQAVYGSIAGTVTDAQGAVVPDATIVITSIERNTPDTVTTNESGLYVKDRLLPGKYKVSIEKTGFKRGEISSVDVNLDRQTEANVALITGDVKETVTISAVEGIELKTDRADVATTFETRQVEELPILDRNLTKLVLLTPGTSQQQWQHAASENPQGSTQIIVNGQTFAGTGYQLDGTDNRDPILGIIVINPNFDAVGETKVTSQNYDAEFGQAIAGVVSVQTKSGSDQFHGTAFDYRIDDKHQARNPFSQAQRNAITGRFIPSTLRNQFGGSIGGPIKRGKAFFFGDYQGTRSRVGGSQLVTVPTALARTGNFSEYNTPIFDPLTGLPFAGNVVPAAGGVGCGVTRSCLSPQALRLLNFLPLPSQPGVTSNFSGSGSELFNNDTWDVRIDSRTSANLNIFGRYSWANFTRNGPAVFGAGGGRELVSLGGTSKVRNQSLAVGFDYTLNPTTVWDVRFGWFKYNVNVLPIGFGSTPATDVGIQGLNFDSFSSGLPDFEVGPSGQFAGFNFGQGLNNNRCNCPLIETEKQYQAVTNLTKLIGNHSFKFGVDLRRAINLRVPSDEHRAGHLQFSNNRTANPNAAPGTNPGGLALATFLIGDVTGFSRYISTALDAGETQWRSFYYGQDTWRVTPKLTIAYGVRLDVINPQKASAPFKAGFPDLDTGQILVAAGGGPVPLNGGVKNSLNFAPRLGGSYQIGRKTVIRAGYGRSYDVGVFGSVFGHTVTQNIPVLATQQLNAANQFARVFTLASGAPAFTNFFGLTAPPNQGGVPNTSVPDSARFFLQDGVRPRAVLFKQRLPTVDAWNVTVQHQLTNSISVEAAYVANKGTHVFAGNNPDENFNQATLQGFFPGRNTNLFKPFFQRFGWTQDVLLYCNCSDNHYDSLQVKMTKRFSQGYQILSNYTLQRARDYTDDRWIGGIDPKIAYGPEDFIRTHSFVFSQLAELPIGTGKRFLTDAGKGLNYLVGGWQINSDTFIQSGLPFNVTYNNAGISDTGPNRPNVNGKPTILGNQNRWFDPTQFSAPSVGTFGNLPRNALRGPRYWRTDASLFKNFIFNENMRLQFRVEVVNLFNHVNFDLPQGNIGNPASPNSNAGQITGNAYGGTDPMRNVQLALRFQF